MTFKRVFTSWRNVPQEIIDSLTESKQTRPTGLKTPMRHPSHRGTERESPGDLVYTARGRRLHFDGLRHPSMFS